MEVSVACWRMKLVAAWLLWAPSKLMERMRAEPRDMASWRWRVQSAKSFWAATRTRSAQNSLR
jgi:hypothetical protein